MIPDSLDRPEPAAAKPISPAKTEWMTAAWFLLGILVGVVGMTVFNALTAKPALDEVAVRAALFEAAATLQAGAPESVNPVSGASSLDATSPTPAAPSTLPASFNLRAANRIGNENAPVTIVEFSDFNALTAGDRLIWSSHR